MAEISKEPWIHRLCIDFSTQGDMLEWFKASVEDGTLPEESSLSVDADSESIRWWLVNSSDCGISYDDLEHLIDALSDMAGRTVN